MQKIIENANKTNPLVNSKTHRLTSVSQEYIDDLEITAPSLLRALETLDPSNGSRTKLYKIATIHKRNLHTSSLPESGNLEYILENKILKETIVWQEMGLIGLTVNLGGGITAELFPGHEEHNTSIKVSDGENSICREIAEYWLDNWSVTKEKV